MARIEPHQVDPVVSATTPGAKLGRQKARQGQNVAGMVSVLVVSLLLVVLGFAAMFAFSKKPAGEELNTPAAASSKPASAT